MRLSESHRCRALLVVVLVGFAALTIHASVHAQPDQQHCELCSGHFNPFHAIAPAARIFVAGGSAEFAESFLPQIRQSQAFISYRQRAPPILD